ncbi:MAG: hypothetical protein BroJett029_19440 [Alphaproteobacteria bacterium]|nr:MAG: hypothetical protein BroJett029_19440 [Alphaproteobacteria bacterium]
MLRDSWQVPRGVPIMALAACAVAVGLSLPKDPALQWPSVDLARAGQEPAISASINRDRKGDRLPRAAAAKEAKRIAVIEIVGVHDVTIIYRDAGGREIFRTGPVGNATITARDIVLPAVTVRDSATAHAAPLTVDVPKRKEADLPIGCESPFSPYADPTAPHRPGRCLSGIADGPHYAALARAP